VIESLFSCLDFAQEEMRGKRGGWGWGGVVGGGGLYKLSGSFSHMLSHALFFAGIGGPAAVPKRHHHAYAFKVPLRTTIAYICICFVTFFLCRCLPALRVQARADIKQFNTDCQFLKEDTESRAALLRSLFCQHSDTILPLFRHHFDTVLISF
jgi:hypothetical protein